ncbi:MAG TPA: hypothetical protein VNW53_10730 [Phenylobacterium sp.]|jgi:hypothetical protein|uniref:hypothetical protein n=1 Tax=Phenylobacterium sp. TaxID=1871053 RepID=UPI002BFA1B3B|nr:hypothetical protein [Phenylobacterium sp.]HXA39466.1 hypothetical protein [Phenylobacterium sp.]
MSAFIVVFEWPAATKIAARTERIEAGGPEEAKLQAALLFASETFEHGLPVRYMVFDGRGGIVFRYPDGV